MIRKLTTAILATVLLTAAGAHAQQARPAPPKDFDKLTWLAGTRYIERDGVKSYETWTGPSAGQISGSVASASNGGLIEFFKVGPNEQGVYGMATARTTTGLDKWSFRPLKTLEANKLVFADASGSFSLEPMPGNVLHTWATRVMDGKDVKTGEWFWQPLK